MHPALITSFRHMPPTFHPTFVSSFVHRLFPVAVDAVPHKPARVNPVRIGNAHRRKCAAMGGIRRTGGGRCIGVRAGLPQAAAQVSERVEVVVEVVVRVGGGSEWGSAAGLASRGWQRRRQGRVMRG